MSSSTRIPPRDPILARRAELLDALDKIANPPCAERVQEQSDLPPGSAASCARLADGAGEDA